MRCTTGVKQVARAGSATCASYWSDVCLGTMAIVGVNVVSLGTMAILGSAGFGLGTLAILGSKLCVECSFTTNWPVGLAQLIQRWCCGAPTTHTEDGTLKTDLQEPQHLASYGRTMC